MVKQPPCISPAVRLPSRAFLEMVVSSRRQLGHALFLFTSLGAGTTGHSGYQPHADVDVFSGSDAAVFGQKAVEARHLFQSGNRFHDRRPLACIHISLRFSASAFCCLRNASDPVISVLSKCVTCGIITQLRLRFAPEIFWMAQFHFFNFYRLLKSTFGHGSIPGYHRPQQPAQLRALIASFT